MPLLPPLQCAGDLNSRTHTEVPRFTHSAIPITPSDSCFNSHGKRHIKQVNISQKSLNFTKDDCLEHITSCQPCVRNLWAFFPASGTGRTWSLALMSKPTNCRATCEFLVVSTQQASASSLELVCHVQKQLVHGSNIPGGYHVVG